MVKFLKSQFKITLVFIILHFSLCLSASAVVNLPDVVVSLQINNPVMKVNGVEKPVDTSNVTAPIIREGRTLMPIRAIVEAFGGKVEWDSDTQTVTLMMNSDIMSLTIDSNIAYYNNSVYVLDVAPAIINNRTMLPIRFVAEKFNLGVAWEESIQTVSIIRNSFDAEEYAYITNNVPAYSGTPYVYVNNNMPLFKNYEIIGGSFEYYSNLDNLGRCDVCIASIATDIMPIGERESISSVTPTGWINAKYDSVDGGYLYNRCHLIGYQLTGENANNKNLITGTRFLNIEGMLPFENMIDSYIENTGNHVLYRVTPVFKESNLVADGVLLEACSVEDYGAGLCLCVYCYNVQPTIYIDYATGQNYFAGEQYNVVFSQDQDKQENTDVASYIYITSTGKRYHYDINCGGKGSYQVTLNEVLAKGLTPCKKCIN